MPVQVTLEGRGLRDLQRKIKVIDAKDLRRELNRGLREGARPLVQDARDAARDSLPSRGGLAERVASRPTTISVTQGGIKVRVKGVDAGSANRGRLRHPVFARQGQPRVWVTQSIPPNYFTDRMRREAPKVRPDLIRAMDRVAEKIADA